MAARVLAGEAPPAAGPAKLAEIAEVRKAAQAAGSDAVARRLLASLGTDLGAALVVAVTVREAGLDPWLASATAERQAWMGRQKDALGLAELAKDANWRAYADLLLRARADRT